MSEVCKHDRRRGHCDECRFFGFQPHAPTPTPDHAQAREYAESLDLKAWPAGESASGAVNLARAYLALAASPQEGREAVLGYDASIGQTYAVAFTPPGDNRSGAPPTLAELLASIAALEVRADGYSYAAFGPKTRAVIEEAVRATPPVAEEGREAWYKRVKVYVPLLNELANESQPVTYRVENEPDGDVMLVMKRHYCPPVAPLPPVVTEVSIGLHTRVEIVYEVDQYRARLIHKNEAVLAEAVGATPSLALAALAERPRG